MKPIKGFKNYVIFPDGTIKNQRTGKVLKKQMNENGYVYTALWKNNKGTTCSVHRLVAETYINNPDKKPFVNHIDADRSNPHVSNLEWCTQSENIQHAYNIGNMSQKRHFTYEETDWLLKQFLGGTSLTHLASSMEVGLSRTTINLRNHSIKVGCKEAFVVELAKQKQQRNTAANVNKRVPVTQHCPETGKPLATFPSATAAARALGKTTSGPIHNVINPTNSQKKAYGFVWKYA